MNIETIGVSYELRGDDHHVVKHIFLYTTEDSEQPQQRCAFYGVNSKDTAQVLATALFAVVIKEIQSIMNELSHAFLIKNLRPTKGFTEEEFRARWDGGSGCYVERMEGQNGEEYFIWDTVWDGLIDDMINPEVRKKRRRLRELTERLLTSNLPFSIS